MSNVKGKEKAPEVVNFYVFNARLKVIYLKGTFSGELSSKDHGMTFVVNAYFKSDEGETFIGFPTFDKVSFDFEKLTGTLTIFGKD